MQIELSRLEIKDILANLMDSAEPEVVEKLRAAIGTNGKPKLALHGPHYVAEFVGTLPNGDPAHVVVEVLEPNKVHYQSDDAWRPLTRADYPHTMRHEQTGEERYVVSDEDIVTINAQRATAFEAAQKMADARKGHTLIDFVETPTRPPAARVAVGGANVQGDRCVKSNEAGQSVFQCKNGHGYVEEGSVTPGCPQCFGGSGSGLGGRQVEATMDADDPRVEAF